MEDNLTSNKEYTKNGNVNNAKTTFEQKNHDSNLQTETNNKNKKKTIN